MSASQARAVRALAEPIVTSLGCDLEEVAVRQAGRRRLVRVVLDHDGGLDLDLVAEVSRALSAALDETDALGPFPYVLEVTSPGVDRPLTRPRHWTRATGRLVQVRLRSGGSLTGRVSASDDAGATLDASGRPVRVRYQDVARAEVQVEFSRVDDAELDDAEVEDEELDDADVEDEHDEHVDDPDQPVDEEADDPDAEHDAEEG